MTAFSPSYALRLAHQVASAYAHALPEQLSVPETDTQAGVVLDGEDCIIAFPGTASRTDVITDLRAAKLPFQVAGLSGPIAFGRVHAGFRSAFTSIIDLLRGAVPFAKPLVFCGHSLGGALAMLAAYHYACAGARVRAVVTFGQPRVGNGPFARAYNARLGDVTWRVVNNRDPVPRIPWMLGTYRHAGREVFMPVLGPPEIEPSLWQRAQRVLAVMSEPTPQNDFVRVSDHTLHAYITRLSIA